MSRETATTKPKNRPGQLPPGYDRLHVYLESSLMTKLMIESSRTRQTIKDIVNQRLRDSYKRDGKPKPE